MTISNLSNTKNVDVWWTWIFYENVCCLTLLWNCILQTEMMSDAIDDALDDDEAEDETEELTNQVSY